jgi:hypothetical protein
LSGLDADKKYGLLVKSDLRTQTFFDVTASESQSLTERITLSGDLVFRADIIIYKINNDARAVGRCSTEGTWER